MVGRACAVSGISLVPQSVNNLDPLMKVGRQVEGVRAHGRAAWPTRRRTPRASCSSATACGEDDGGPVPLRAVGRHGAARASVLRAHGRSARHSRRRAHARAQTCDLAVRALDDFRAFADAGGGVHAHHPRHRAGPARGRPRGRVSSDGTVVEETAVANFASPDTLAHPFSRALWHALPEHGFRDRNVGCRGLAREVSMLEARGITYAYPGAARAALPRLRPGSCARRAGGPLRALGLRQDHALPPAGRLRAPASGRGPGGRRAACRGAVRAPCR